MKSRQGTAGRYAKALFSIAREGGNPEAVGRELEQFAGELTASPALAAVLQRPWIKPAERQGVATEVAKRAGCGASVQKAIGLVASRGRMDHLPELVASYHALVDEQLGRVRAEVRTAVALSADEKRELAARLGRALGKQVIVEETVDTSLLGGFVAQVGSLILYGSLDGQLARMRERLARG
jgi:F-type H+-transporting ATPase subunit delta